MIVLGGLGNQMFQYAFVLALREQGKQVQMDTSMYNLIVMHNGYELDRVFGIKEKTVCKQGIHLYLLRALNRLKPASIATFDNFIYNEEALFNPKNFIWGFWQDERYFKKVDIQVRNVFSFKDIDNINMNIAHEMGNINSVAMHIRRGDYSEYGMSLVDENYYRNAVKIISELVPNPEFFIFSDDEKEAERIGRTLGVSYRMMNHNKGLESYKDIYLMSKCKHNIIANSSFSWWGAWLNNNPNKQVIAPLIWEKKRPEFRPQAKNWILI